MNQSRLVKNTELWNAKRILNLSHTKLEEFIFNFILEQFDENNMKKNPWQ